jgi:hypothetical protein
MVYTLKQILLQPNTKPYSDIQLLQLFTLLSKGYSIHQASLRVKKCSSRNKDDNTRYVLPLQQLRDIRTFNKLFIRTFMIQEQVETSPDVVDFVLTCNSEEVLRYRKFIVFWLTGAYQVPSNKIKALLLHVNKVFLLSEILRRRSNIDKWDIQIAYGNISYVYKCSRRKLILREQRILSSLVAQFISLLNKGN